MGEMSTATRAEGEVARQIARAAARLFAERGYDATSVREIVEAAGVTKPTLYYHFGSKQGLAEALLTRPMTDLVARLRALPREEPDTSRLLVRAVETKLAFLEEEPERARFFYAICFGAQCSTLRDEMHRFGAELDRAMLDCFDRAAEGGLIEPGRAGHAFEVCRGMVISASFQVIFFRRGLEPGLAGRLVSDLLRGFGHRGTDR
jgi:AcrR family transcriptional regulator